MIEQVATSIQQDMSWVPQTVQALAVFIPATVAAVISFLTWRDNHRGKEAAERREVTLNKVADAVGVIPGKPTDAAS